MDHKEAATWVWDYHDGALPADIRPAFEAHLATCALCRRELSLWRLFASRFLAPLSQLPSEESAAFARRVMARVAADEPAPRVDWRELFRLGRLVPALGALAAAAALLFTPALSFHQDPIEALLRQDEDGARFADWLSDTTTTRADAFTIMTEGE